jgi:hypothetical protein
MDTVAARLPVQFCTYPALIPSSILTEGPKGPNTIGELLYPVTVEQCADDHCDGCTRVGFSYIAPPAEEQAAWIRWEQRPTPFGVGVFPVVNGAAA